MTAVEARQHARVATVLATVEHASFSFSIEAFAEEDEAPQRVWSSVTYMLLTARSILSSALLSCRERPRTVSCNTLGEGKASPCKVQRQQHSEREVAWDRHTRARKREASRGQQEEQEERERQQK